MFTAASVNELDDLWVAFLSIDKEFPHDNFSGKELSGRLINHSCIQRHYFLTLSSDYCDTCLPTRIAPNIFYLLSILQFWLQDMRIYHCKKFSDVFGTKKLDSIDFQAQIYLLA